MSDDLNKGGGFEEFKPSEDKYNAEQDALNESLVPKEEYSVPNDQPTPQQTPTPSQAYEAPKYTSTPASNEILTGDTKLYSGLCHLSNAVGGLLLFTLLWPPILFYFLKGDDPIVKFHAKQATIVCLSALALGVISSIVMVIISFLTAGCGTCIILPVMMIVGLGILGYLIYVTVKVFQGENFRIPVISDWADSLDI